ncbi:MAG TPA: helix-turn-helix transcriptional regulator [Petrotogaceae bacterium]|nr:helix-turn-helix transcriptional regulator [Petrotogaceae bacterium]
MFSDKLKELRQKNNLTQEQLAQKINTTRKNISAYETGCSALVHRT